MCACLACVVAALAACSYAAESTNPQTPTNLNAQALNIANTNQDLAVARQALRDGLWQVARSHAQKLAGDAARLVVLESFASENRWADVKAELKKIAHPEENPAFGYYLAVCAGRVAEAVQFLRSAGSEAGLAEARMLEADLYVRSSNLKDARRLWTEVVALTNAGERAFALASVNLGDVAAMRKAYARTLSVPLKRMVGLRLGRALVDDPKTEDEGAKFIRAIVKDSPDAEGACEAFVALAAADIRAKRWKEALKTLSDAAETWPEAIKRADLHEYRGEAQFRLGQFDDSRRSFVRAEELATDDPSRARSVLKQGDALSELGRGEEAMARYRRVLEKYPSTETAVALKRIFSLRELEKRGRGDFHAYRFADAMKAFAEVAAADPDRKPRMDYFRVLCLYGLGRDEEALQSARTLAKDCTDAIVRAEALLWLAKFTYNRGEWREAALRFSAFAEAFPENAFAPEALLWAARAVFAARDFPAAIQAVTRLVGKYPSSAAVTPALLVQADALVEQARFDEAVLVLDRLASTKGVSREDRRRARLLKADALFAMGADNPARYLAALETYRAVVTEGTLDPDSRLATAFKIGRVLEKLKRPNEATDQYYAEVVLAYRDGRSRGETFGGEGETAFVRAAFRLADDFESHGRDYQAIGVLKLVAESAIPASAEAEKRIERITKKGRFL